METPNVPAALRQARPAIGPEVDLDSVTYYVGGPILIATKSRRHMAPWRKRLFAFLSRNAARSATFFDLPSDRVIEIGIPIDL